MSPWHCGDKDHHSIVDRGDIVHKEYGHVSMKIKKPLRTGCTKTGGEGIDEEKIGKIILLGPLYKELIIDCYAKTRGAEEPQDMSSGCSWPIHKLLSCVIIKKYTTSCSETSGEQLVTFRSRQVVSLNWEPERIKARSTHQRWDAPLEVISWEGATSVGFRQ